MTHPLLFQPIQLRELTVPHRLWVSPMCQYSAIEGVVQHWHAVHLGAWATHKAGLIITEATAVAPEGRISDGDAGIWNDTQVDAWKPIVAFSKQQGVPIVVQLAHAGRKGSTRVPFVEGDPILDPAEGGWVTVAPSAVAFGDMPVPHALTVDEIHQVVKDFADSAARAVRAGFDAVEIHAAHGYLVHEFLSPLANLRGDEYGGEFEGRTRLVREIVTAVREVLPEGMPLFVRLSATDWLEGGWNIDETVKLCEELEALGADFLDISSGGLHAGQKIQIGPGYQMPFAHAIKDQVSVPVGTVGLITSAEQAEQALEDNIADVVLMGRQFLREPSFATRAAAELGADLAWAGQYLRAKR
jgi:2,4-dienoyl-CoA reductase-like NADH-dependent reductase (Old Yellow Enzyme family)